MKRCSKCGEEFPATTEYWHRYKSQPDGLYYYCKLCERTRSREAKSRLVTDPLTGETITAGALSTRRLVTDPETGETLRAGALSNRRLVTDPLTGETLRAGTLSTRRLVTDPATGETLRAGALSTRKRYQNGKRQEYLDNNPLAKMRAGLSNLINSSMRNKGWSKTTKTQALVGCDFEFFQLYIEEQFTEGMSWENAGEWHYDHILCCASATTETELIALQHYSNFQPMWGSANISKGASLPSDWRERKAALLLRIVTT